MSDTPRTDAFDKIEPAGRFDGWSDFARGLERENAELRAEVQRLKERLEITHVYDMDGNKQPAPEGIPDGIDCRDETIKLMNQNIDRLRARIAELEK